MALFGFKEDKTKGQTIEVISFNISMGIETKDNITAAINKIFDEYYVNGNYYYANVYIVGANSYFRMSVNCRNSGTDKKLEGSVEYSGEFYSFKAIKNESDVVTVNTYIAPFSRTSEVILTKNFMEQSNLLLKYGNVVELMLAVTPKTSSNSIRTVGTIPQNFRPRVSSSIPATVYIGSTIQTNSSCTIQTGGTITGVFGNAGTIYRTHLTWIV